MFQCSQQLYFYFFYFYYYYFFGPRHVTCSILVPPPGIVACGILVPAAVETCSLNHWTVREFPYSSFIFLNIYLFYLFIFFIFFGCIGSLLRHSGFSLVVACSLQGEQAQQLWCLGLIAPRHVGSQFPDQGLNLHPLHWKVDSFTTGPPEKSPAALFYYFQKLYSVLM